MSPKNPISRDAIFLSKPVETVRFLLAEYTVAAHKLLPAANERRAGRSKIKNAANRRKTACSGAFGVPDTTRTCDPGLRRLVLYPTELLGHISKIFNFSAQTDSNGLPLRRRTLYPAELRKLTSLFCRCHKTPAYIILTNTGRKVKQKTTFSDKLLSPIQTGQSKISPPRSSHTNIPPSRAFCFCARQA